MASIISIVYCPSTLERKPPGRYSRVPTRMAELIEGAGIQGDVKARIKDRHLNVMALETLEQLRCEGFHTAPGEMGEQIVVDGIDLARLEKGERLKLGKDAIIEMIVPRTGCDRFEKIQGLPKGRAAGRLGIMARVLVSGAIGVGDPVEALPAIG